MKRPIIDKSEISLKRKKYEISDDFNKQKQDMANNKRKKKRKHSLNGVLEDSQNQIKTEVNDDGSIKIKIIDEVLDQDVQEISTDENIQFNGKLLRDSFKSGDGISMLKKFVTICNQDFERDIAAEYMQAGGNVLEILRLLDTSDKKNIGNACTVFSAMYIIIMKILAKYPQNQSNAEEACRHLINTQLVIVHQMLSSQAQAKHRKIILRLLTAIVSLGGTLPRELLNHLSLHTQLLEALVSQSKPTDKESVRTCYIHFILAFLIEGQASDIRTLLEKRGIISIIFPGLIYDYSNLVQLVLTTVKKYVLENLMISKTTKLRVFSTAVVNGIVNLYNWKGPTNWPGFSKQKLVTENIDIEEKKVAVSSVHEFLIALLTSKKCGIVFHDGSLGTLSYGKHNQLISTVLQSLERPWEHDKPSELVIKILMACPDLIKTQLVFMEPFLNPRVSKKWVAAIHFVREIISNIDEERCLKACSSELSVVQLTNAILNLILPQIIIKNVINPSLEQNSYLIHYEIINLLIVMMKKAESFIKIFKDMKLSISENCYFKNTILENVSKQMPSFESILNIWVKAFSQESVKSDEEEVFFIQIKQHLLTILNLLEIYNEICPEVLLTTESDSVQKNSMMLLTSLNNLNDVTEDESAIMKIKSLKILLHSNATQFLPNEEIFNVALMFLTTKAGNKDILLDTEIRCTLNLLLTRTKVFEGCNDQIEILMYALTFIDDFNDKSEVADWIAKTIKYAFKHTDKLISSLRQFEENIGDELLETDSQDLFHELIERNIEDVEFFTPMLPVTSISIFLYAALENLKKCSSEPLLCFISVILVHTLHCQISAKTLISLVGQLKVPVLKYIENWLNVDKLLPLKKPFHSDNVFRIISVVLFCPNQIHKISVKETLLCIETDSSSMMFSLTGFEIKASFRMIVFYLTQLLRKNKIELKTIEVYTTILLSLLEIASEAEKNSGHLLKDCAKWFFKHPIILQYFKGIHKNENSLESRTTLLFIQICSVFTKFKKQCLLSQYLYPYREKLITDIKYAISKIQVKDLKRDMKGFAELIECLQLNTQNTSDLLTTIISLPYERMLILDSSELSIWGIMIHELIERILNDESRTETGVFNTINSCMLKKLFQYTIALRKFGNEVIDLWEKSLYKYLLKFPHSISEIDKSIFILLIKNNGSLTNTNILKLILERNPKFITVFVKYANNNKNILEQASLMFSMLSSNLKYKWNQEFLNALHNNFKADITTFITNPKKNEFSWIRENLNAIDYLIMNTFDAKLCLEISSTILLDGNKLEEVNEDHIKLFEKIFKKSLDIKSDALKDFIQVLLRVTVITLKKDSKNVTKLNFLCKTIIKSINFLKLESNFIFEELNKNYSWPQFSRIILKIGLKITKGDKQQESFLLKALISACEVTYTDNANEEYVKTIFEMTTSHSEFVNIMLSNTSVKCDLVKLLYTLVIKNHSVMVTTHVPLYLASYNATLSASDQCILKILKHYENCGIKLDGYRPYLWGNSAASHYSIKGETDTALWRQPSTSQVLDLLDSEIVNNTINNFATQRQWKAGLEDCITVNNEIYDPSFYLPVFNNLLADNNIILCHKVIHSGALGLTIVACSSSCKQMRLAAYTVISRFYFHLEAARSKEKLIWINMIDALRNGIVKTKLNLEEVRLNGFVATFLAKTCSVITQPMNPLYSRLQSFLMAKPALDLNTVPEFLQLYHSSEIEHLAHRHWILEVVRDGMNLNDDAVIALNCFMFKLLFDFYICSLSDKLTKNLILQIVKSSTKLSKLCLILVNGYGLLPWLLIVTTNLKKGDLEASNCIVDIINNILNVFHVKNIRETHHHLMLVKTLLSLQLQFNQNMNVDSLKKFIDVLNKVIINSDVCNVFTIDHLKELVKFCKQLFKDLRECELMLQFGCKFMQQANIDLGVDESLERSLYKLILTWYNYLSIKL